MTTQPFDAIIIGAGQAGGPLAGALAKAGYRTALIERRYVGGTCINDGCTPTKTMVASARIAHLARRASAYGVSVPTSDVAVDLAAVHQRKQHIVQSFRAGSTRRLEDAGVELIEGSARFTGERSVAIATKAGSIRLSAPVIFINTGGRPIVPPIPGLDQVPTLTSTSIMELTTLPAALVVLGGGYIGLEFAQMFRRFGSRVTVIQHGPQLLGREDDDIAAAVADVIRDDGVELLLNAELTRAARTPTGELELSILTPSGMHKLEATHLLVATGRAPNTESLALEAAGVETDARGFIRVNGRLETSAPGVYALGDVKGGPAFTHISYDDFRIIRTNLLEGGSASTRGRPVPYTVFIDPQLGRIGMTEAEARASGRNILVATMPMTHVARAIEMDETRGFMKAIADADTHEILGAAVLGVEGGELVTLLQVAMMGGLKYEQLRDAIWSHPTLAESLNNLFAGLAAQSSGNLSKQDLVMSRHNSQRSLETIRL